MFKLQDISKKMGAFSLSQINLEIEAGEYFVLLGASGVGKTVLLEMIAGVVSPDDGGIFWQGSNLTDIAPEKRPVAMVYQDYALFPHMSVEKNILYGRQDIEKCHVLAEKFSITNLLKRFPGKLSGGEQQRVSLARAMMRDPEIYLFDEPLAALDPHARRRFQKDLKDLHAVTGKTFIHVTHDVEEAKMLGERVAIVLNQQIYAIGTVSEILENPSDPKVREFLGLDSETEA
ncbi:MAG: ATP-binding cassette domain-containing protein [Alphaproteobacteria bacterium]